MHRQRGHILSDRHVVRIEQILIVIFQFLHTFRCQHLQRFNMIDFMFTTEYFLKNWQISNWVESASQFCTFISIFSASPIEHLLHVAKTYQCGIQWKISRKMPPVSTVTKYVKTILIVLVLKQHISISSSCPLFMYIKQPGGCMVPTRRRSLKYNAKTSTTAIQIDLLLTFKQTGMLLLDGFVLFLGPPREPRVVLLEKRHIAQLNHWD